MLVQHDTDHLDQRILMRGEHARIHAQSLLPLQSARHDQELEPWAVHVKCRMLRCDSI